MKLEADHADDRVSLGTSLGEVGAMRVTIHYLAQLRRAVGVNKETVEAADGVNLVDLVRHAAAAHPSAAAMLLGPDGRPNRSLLFFVNDAPADWDAAVPPLADITILAPMAGG